MFLLLKIKKYHTISTCILYQRTDEKDNSWVPTSSRDWQKVTLVNTKFLAVFTSLEAFFSLSRGRACSTISSRFWRISSSVGPEKKRWQVDINNIEVQQSALFRIWVHQRVTPLGFHPLMATSHLKFMFTFGWRDVLWIKEYYTTILYITILEWMLCLEIEDCCPDFFLTVIRSPWNDLGL